MCLPQPPKTREPQWENGFRLVLGTLQMDYLNSHEKYLPLKREGGRNSIMLQLWVLLATEILKEKTSQIVLRNLCLLGEVQLNTVFHLFKIHRTKFVT